MVVAREAYKEAWLQGSSAVVALPAACLVNTVQGLTGEGHYDSLYTFDRVLRNIPRIREVFPLIFENSICS